jgi:hypothetical protein
MRAPLVLLCPLLCCSCAHLEVQVGVLNPAYLEAHSDQEGDRKRLVVVLTSSEQDIRAQLQPARDRVEAQYDAVAELYKAAAAKPGVVDPENLLGAARSLQEHAKPDFGANIFDPTVQALLAIKTQILQRLAQEPGQGEVDILDGSKRIPDDIRGLLSKRSARIRQFENDAQRELIRLGAKAENPKLSAEQRDSAAGAIRAAGQEVSQSLASLIGPSGSVADDVNAFLVASAPPDQWEPTFNKTLVDARWGNLDTAIKLIGLAEFTIKGVTFDPSKVAQVASKVATQSLLIATQIAGVPVKLQGSGAGAGTTGGAPLAQTSAAVADMETQIGQQTAAAKDYRSALIDIAQAILRETPQIVGPKGSEDSSPAKDTRLAAIKAIQASFDAQKARLTISASPASPAPQTK